MNTTTSAVLAGLIVVAGRWAQKESITIRVAVGVATMAIFLAVIGQINTKFAQQLGTVFVVAALFVPPSAYGGKSKEPFAVSIVKALGLTARRGGGGSF